jgi:hypothetical protein
LVRRLVSVKRELPPSMMMSPFQGTAGYGRWSHHDRPALTISMTAAGFFSARPALGSNARRPLVCPWLRFDEIVDLRNGAIETATTIAVVVHVQDQILAHDSQTDQCDVTTLRFHKGS